MRAAQLKWILLGEYLHSGVYYELDGWVCHYDDTVSVVYCANVYDGAAMEDEDFTREEKRRRDRLKKKPDPNQPKTYMCSP